MSRERWPTLQAVGAGANVGQTWRNGGQSLGSLAAAAIPPTNPPGLGTAPVGPDAEA